MDAYTLYTGFVLGLLTAGIPFIIFLKLCERRMDKLRSGKLIIEDLPPGKWKLYKIGFWKKLINRLRGQRGFQPDYIVTKEGK